MKRDQIKVILLEAKRHEALANVSADPAIATGHLEVAGDVRAAARVMGRRTRLIPVRKGSFPCK